MALKYTTDTWTVLDSYSCLCECNLTTQPTTTRPQWNTTGYKLTRMDNNTEERDIVDKWTVTKMTNKTNRDKDSQERFCKTRTNK